MSQPAHVRAFQDYLEAIAEKSELPTQSNRNLLLSYAELQFKLHGGSQCAVCRASVRHVLPVTVERMDGSSAEYSCLCRRCIEAEKVNAKRIVLKIGEASIEHVAESRTAKAG